MASSTEKAPTLAERARMAAAPPSREPVTAPSLHGFTLEALRELCGPGEWEEIQDNPAALEAFALALREERQVAAGVRPQRWRSLAHCPECGAVWVPPFLGVPGDEEGPALVNLPTLNHCRWCELREAGKRYPRPYPLPPRGGAAGWPWSESCRPWDWQGRDERGPGNPGGGFIDHTQPGAILPNYPARIAKGQEAIEGMRAALGFQGGE